MLMPSIFGENLFNDDWMDFGFPEVDKALYGKHANNVRKLIQVMKLILIFQDLRRMKLMHSLITVTLQ